MSALLANVPRWFGPLLCFLGGAGVAASLTAGMLTGVVIGLVLAAAGTALVLLQKAA